MAMKTIAGFALAAFLIGCGGDSDLPEEMKGTWSKRCTGNIIETYALDEGLVLMAESYSGLGCTNRRSALTAKLNALYEPELQASNGDVDALRAKLTLDGNIMFTPYDRFSLQSYKNTCPQQVWVMGQATSIMACEHESAKVLIAKFEEHLPNIFYIKGNYLHAGNSTSPKGANGLPLDMDYGNPYVKQ